MRQISLYLQQLRLEGRGGKHEAVFLTICRLLTVADPPPLRPPRTVQSVYTKGGKTNLWLQMHAHARTHTNPQRSDGSVRIKSRGPGITHGMQRTPPPPPPPLLETFKETSCFNITGSRGDGDEHKHRSPPPSDFWTRSHQALQDWSPVSEFFSTSVVQVQQLLLGK